MVANDLLFVKGQSCDCRLELTYAGKIIHNIPTFTLFWELCHHFILFLASLSERQPVLQYPIGKFPDICCVLSAISAEFRNKGYIEDIHCSMNGFNSDKREIGKIKDPFFHCVLSSGLFHKFQFRKVDFW